jgi:DNA-directed RNA polymerase specialized sigma24 family protein
MSYDPSNIDPLILDKLTRKARVFASKFDGIEVEEYLSEAWLAFNSEKLKGRSDTAGLVRAEYSLIDLQKEWIDHDSGQTIMDGVISEWTHMPQESKKIKRTKLPRKLKKLMKFLTEEERRILYLSFMWNRRPNEIATAMNIKESRVVSLKYKSLNKLKNWYENGYPSKKIRKEREPMKSFSDVMSPEGVIYKIDTTLRKFCDTHNLDAKLMSLMLNGKNAKTHKGWSVVEPLDNGKIMC